MTRVLLLSQAPGVGGGERCVVDALARAESLRVTVAGYEPVCAFARERGLQAVELVLPRARRAVDVLGLPGAGRRVLRLARRLDAGVLYANGIRAVGPAVAARVMGGPPLLVHHHGQFGSGPRRPYVSGIRAFAGAIVADSPWSARPFGETPKLRVVENGVDTEHFRPAAAATDAKGAYGLTPGTPVVGMLTRPHPSKGTRAFLELAGRLGDVHFLLAGGPAFPGEEEHFDELGRRAAERGLRVAFTGPLDDPRPAYAAMDVLVHLGQPEGLSLVLLEAWACGVPVVAYRWGAIGEAIEDGVTGVLVAPGDLDRVAAAVQKVTSDGTLAERLARDARRSCVARFGIGRMAASLRDAVLVLA